VQARDSMESLTVEVYDDFPSLALISTSYKNSAAKNVSLASVELQKHVLDATLADHAAKYHHQARLGGLKDNDAAQGFAKTPSQTRIQHFYSDLARKFLDIP
jgi:hypothetical protein